MLRWTLALLLGLIISCANGGGGKEGPTLPLSPTPHLSDAQTSEDRKTGAPQLTPKIDTTRTGGTAQVDAGGQTPTAGPQATPTLEVGSQFQAGNTPTVETESPSGPVVTLGGVAFRVELAISSEERILGLSGRPPLAPGAGMLFVLEQAERSSFWMRGMLFPLDMVWIDAECTVVHITRNAPAPAPAQALADLPRFGPPVPILYVLEINAGEAESAGITVGSPARFTGSLTGRFGC